jgi:hypothetical protein
MADLFFLLAGIVLFVKREVKISRQRTLTGRPVQILAVLYLLPFIASFGGGFVISAIGAPLDWAMWPSLGLITVAIAATLYLILFYKQ